MIVPLVQEKLINKVPDIFRFYLDFRFSKFPDFLNFHRHNVFCRLFNDYSWFKSPFQASISFLNNIILIKSISLIIFQNGMF